MKKIIVLLIGCLWLCSCSLFDSAQKFEAVIIEKVDVNQLLVESQENDRLAVYKVSFHDVDLETYEKHDVVEITYDGKMTDTPIQQITASDITMIQESDYLFVVKGLSNHNSWRYYSSSDNQDMNLEYIIKNNTKETRYAGAPSFSRRTSEGEWIGVEYTGEIDLTKYPIEEIYTATLSLDDYVFEEYGLVRTSVPIYDEDVTHSEPVEVVTSIFILDLQ